MLFKTRLNNEDLNPFNAYVFFTDFEPRLKKQSVTQESMARDPPKV